MHTFDLLLLPKDILLDILLRLPTKTLVLIASTSKTLYNFITNPSFITTHFNNSKKNPFIFLAFYNDSHQKKNFGLHKFCIHPDNDSSNWDFNFKEMPLRSRVAERFLILGCCNGLICLADESHSITHRVYLWNPCISRYIALPIPSVTFHKYGPYDRCFGFGFDERTNDYKVVRIAYLESLYYSTEDPPFVEVYAIASGLWRFVDYDSSRLKLRIITNDFWEFSQCFVEGAVHWLAFSKEDSDSKAIVTFNVSDESFGEMNLPPSLGGSIFTESERLTLRTCWDMLAVISSTNAEFCIWVMKEYGVEDSWTKMCTFTCPNLRFNESIGFRANKDTLFCVVTSGQFCYLVTFSVKLDGSMIEQIETICGEHVGFHVSSYEESLVLFKEGKSTFSDESKDKKVDDNNDVQGNDVSDGVADVNEKEAQGLKTNDQLS